MTLPNFTWINFFVATIVLGLIYVAIRLLYALLKQQVNKPKLLYQIQQGLFRLIQLYEIIVFLVLGMIFIFIHPVLHGLFLLAIAIFGFSHIRNYVSGRLVLLDDNIAIGKRLKTGNIKGVIVKLGLFDAQIRTATGISFVNYVRLFQEGYSLIDVEEIGGFYEFELTPTNTSNKNHIQTLQDAFFMMPYLDANRQPELINDLAAGKIEARVLIREDSHIDDFTQLLKKLGYQCEVKISD